MPKNTPKIDEKAVSELSSIITTWGKKYKVRFSKHIKFNSQEIDIELRVMKPVIERKLVD